MIKRFRHLAYVQLFVTALHAATAGDPLPRSTPEAQGVSSADVLDFVKAADENVDTMHSVMIVRHGKVICEAWWEPEAPDKPHVMWSLTKSFTSMAIGLAIHDGKLSLDDKVLKFFPDKAPENPSDNLKAMSVRDLLTMTCGHETEAGTAGRPTVEEFLAHPVPHEPGTFFKYNTSGTHMLSAIITQATEQSVLDYLTPRLFEPLGIEKPRWDAAPDGLTLGGYGLYLRTEDVAKFGQLLLQKGKWNDAQLIPEDWIAQAASKQVSNAEENQAQSTDWQQGYGFQFWLCQHNAVRGDGAAGQFCILIPESDAAIAITAETGDMQGILDIVWEKLLPAFHDEALPESAVDQESLKQAISKLVAHPKKREN